MDQDVCVGQVNPSSKVERLGLQCTVHRTTIPLVMGGWKAAVGLVRCEVRRPHRTPAAAIPPSLASVAGSHPLPLYRWERVASSRAASLTSRCLVTFARPAVCFGLDLRPLAAACRTKFETVEHLCYIRFVHFRFRIPGYD